MNQMTRHAPLTMKEIGVADGCRCQSGRLVGRFECVLAAGALVLRSCAALNAGPAGVGYRVKYAAIVHCSVALSRTRPRTRLFPSWSGWSAGHRSCSYAYRLAKIEDSAAHPPAIAGRLGLRSMHLGVTLGGFHFGCMTIFDKNGARHDPRSTNVPGNIRHRGRNRVADA